MSVALADYYSTRFTLVNYVDGRIKWRAEAGRSGPTGFSVEFGAEAHDLDSAARLLKIRIEDHAARLALEAAIRG